MKMIPLSILFTVALSPALLAETCREVVRDSSGRIAQTIDRQKSSDGSLR